MEKLLAFLFGPRLSENFMFSRSWIWYIALSYVIGLLIALSLGARWWFIGAIVAAWIFRAVTWGFLKIFDRESQEKPKRKEKRDLSRLVRRDGDMFEIIEEGEQEKRKRS